RQCHATGQAGILWQDRRGRSENGSRSCEDRRTEPSHGLLGRCHQIASRGICAGGWKSLGLNSTVTLGIVSALGRGHMGITQYEDFIQTDAAINPGNSGGALVNTAGESVGINTAIVSQTGGYQGVGFAVPAHMAKPVHESLA